MDIKSSPRKIKRFGVFERGFFSVRFFTPQVTLVCLFVCLLVYQAESTWGLLDRISASLAALPGEASPTRACLGTIIGHESGEGDEGEMSIPCPGDVIVLSCIVRPTLPTLPLSEWEKHYNCYAENNPPLALLP